MKKNLKYLDVTLKTKIAIDNKHKLDKYHKRELRGLIYHSIMDIVENDVSEAAYEFLMQMKVGQINTAKKQNDNGLFFIFTSGKEKKSKRVINRKKVSKKREKLVKKKFVKKMFRKKRKILKRKIIPIKPFLPKV